MTTVKQHLQLLAYSFVTWLTFYLIGLPDYYQQWYFWAKVVILCLVTLLYFPVTRYTLLNYWNDDRHLVNSCWLALYLTLPLFTYDYLLLGWYKGLGIGFVQPYWYLTFFYFSFWIQFPAIGLWMERESRLNPAEPELTRDHRLSKDYELDVESSQAMIYGAMIRRLA